MSNNFSTFEKDNIDNIDKNPKSKSKSKPFLFINKFKTAVIAFILFIILSNKVSYKILDLILKLFSKNTEIIDDEDNPLLLGIFINAFILAFLLFIF